MFLRARCFLLRAFLLPLLPLIWGCQNKAPSKEPDLSKAPIITKIRSVPPSAGTRSHYRWGDLVTGPISLRQAPKNWRQGTLLKLKARAYHLPAMNSLPESWGQPSNTALILSETLILPPKTLTFLFGEKQPAPRLLLSNQNPHVLQARSTLSADIRVHGGLRLEEAERELRNLKKSLELLSETMIIAEGLGSYLDLFIGREDTVFDSQSSLSPRAPKRLARLGLSRNSSLYPTGLQLSLKARAPSFQGEVLDEEVLFNPFFVPEQGLTLALVLQSPICTTTATLPSALVFLLKVEKTSWSEEAMNLALVEGDLAKQRVLSSQLVGTLQDSQGRRGRLDLTQQLFREIALELDLVASLNPKPRVEEWRSSLRQWSLKGGLGQSGIDFMERVFGEAWHPGPRVLRSKGPQVWLQRALNELDELADGEVFEELVILNRKALEGKLNQRWRAMEWFRWFFPEIPQREVPFALQPSPAFLVVLDSVLASRGLEARRQG